MLNTPQPPEDEYQDLDSVVENAGNNPFYGPISADEDASPEEEAVLSQVMHELGTLMYKDGASNKIASMMENSPGKELFAIIPELAKPMIQKGYEIANEIDPEIAATVVFGEEGVIHQVNDMMFELAQQIGHPDAEDQEQYMASLTMIYNKVGEHMQETGDKQGLEQLGQLGVDMTMQTEEGRAADRGASVPQQQVLPQEIQGILGTGGEV
jgi:hypothetical protein